MGAQHYTYRIGVSANGRTLHPSETDPEEGVRFTSLGRAMSEAEQDAGRTLTWLHNQDVQTWTAIIGDGRVAEISKGAIVGIRLSVATMT